jgi:hypothetical protein
VKGPNQRAALHVGMLGNHDTMHDAARQHRAGSAFVEIHLAPTTAERSLKLSMPRDNFANWLALGDLRLCMELS